MIDWLLRSIGVQEDVRSHLARAQLVFQWPLAFWLGLLVLVPLGLYIYIHQRPTLATAPRPLRIALSATRIVILFILLLVLAGPYLKLDETIERRPVLALVQDHSQSMALPAGPFEDETQLAALAAAAGYHLADGQLAAETRKLLNQTSRARLVYDVLQARGEAFWKTLAEKYDVRHYALGETLVRLPPHSGGALPEPKPESPATRLGDALAQLLDESAGRPMAGVVLFTDGQNTAGRAPQEAARALRQGGTPVICVPPGSEAPLRDLAVADLFAPDLVSQGDTVQVSVTLELRGYDQQPVKVLLREEGTAQPLAEKELTVRGTEQAQVNLSFRADAPGARTLTVEVQPMAELPEDLKENNADSVLVRVSDEKLKVLYLEGLPRWDFRFLKNAMRRDFGLAGRTAEQPDIVLEAEYRRLPPSERPPLPATLDELAEYHVVVIGDVSPALLDSSLLSLIDQAVRERGVGLIVQAGTRAMPHAYDARLLDLLPVRMRARAAGMQAPAYKPFRLQVTAEGASHECLRLYDDPQRSENVWAQMPPSYWCAAAERPSAGATVLARNASVETRYGKLPLVAWHFAGQGRVLFVGTDSTWLWRQNVADRYFYRFWGQALRFVARKEEQVRKRSYVEVRPPRAHPGEEAQVELFAFTPEGVARQEPELAVNVWREGAAPQPLELAADPSVPGRYTGKLVPEGTGSYRVQFEPGGGQPPVEARLHVAVATGELRQPEINLATLESLGQLVRLTELDRLASLLHGEPEKTELHREASLWDNWLVLLVLIVVYSVDVGLRRLSGLS
jgi:hypothetical protein